MINIIISSDPRYIINRSAIQGAILNVLKSKDVKGRVEVEVSVVGDRKMHELNKKYRKIDDTTDVLSFALEDPSSNVQLLPRGFISSPDAWLRLGSIVISYPQAVADASLEGTSVEEEISFLVEHGTNHLLGIHHD